MNRKLFLTLSALAVLIALLACSSNQSSSNKTPGVEQAVGDAVDVYIYGYPLVTMDMTRRQMTNVATARCNACTHWVSY